MIEFKYTTIGNIITIDTPVNKAEVHLNEMELINFYISIDEYIQNNYPMLKGKTSDNLHSYLDERFNRLENRIEKLLGA